MRLTGIDLMIACGIYAGLRLVALMIFGFGDAALVFPAVLFPVTYLTLGSYLYKRLKFSPMRLPRCPHCHGRDRFLQAEYVMDRATLVCEDCGGTFEVWYSQPPEEYGPGACPELISRFPRVIGRYQSLFMAGPPAEPEPVWPEEVHQLLLSTAEITDPIQTAADLRKVGCSGELLADLPESLHPDRFFQLCGTPDAVLVESTFTNDRATNGRNLCRCRQLAKRLGKPNCKVRVYEPVTRFQSLGAQDTL